MGGLSSTQKPLFPPSKRTDGNSLLILRLTGIDLLM
jgi:hypothetical protein